MNIEDAIYNDSSQRQHHEVMRHEIDRAYYIQREEYGLFEQLKPKIFIDGNQWCVLYGDNIQDGVTGFGETPYKAILAFNSAFHNTITIKDENDK